MDNIENDKYYEMALEKVQSLMLKKPEKASLEGQELEMLITLIEAYEDIHFPMSASDPIAYLHFKMQQENLKQKDLIPFIGDKSKVSKVLNKKQELTVLMIKKLSLGLNIPLNYLISLSV